MTNLSKRQKYVLANYCFTPAMKEAQLAVWAAEAANDKVAEAEATKAFESAAGTWRSA